METRKFRNELRIRQYKIVSFLSSLFLGIGLLGSAAFIIVLILRPDSVSESEHFINLGMTLGFTSLFAYIRFFYIKKNFKVSFIFILILITISAVVVIFDEGTNNAITYILIFLALLSSSIVLGVKYSTIYYLFIAFVVNLIGLLQEMGSIPRSNSDEFIIQNTLMYTLLVGIGAYVAKLGYNQIEHSYDRAYNYAKDLEKLNLELDDKVKLRTKQLKKSFEAQAESIHSAAVMGMITRPMLHDLATPISSLKGSFDLLKKGKEQRNLEDLLEVSDESVKQIIRIIDNSRDMMAGKNAEAEFSPRELISTSLFVLKHEFQKEQIKVDVKVDPTIKIKGSPGIFERIIVNIVLNAIEELREMKGGRKTIKIKGNEKRKFFYVIIRDSGRGIKKKYLKNIFDTDFSLKSERGSLGFGLSFVKSSIEKFFMGSIQVKSEYGKYTEVIMKFDKNAKSSRDKYKKSKKISSKKKR